MLCKLPARRSAFTLVELLVVIGIIALLISILLPALTAAKKQAAAVKCAAQLREIGNAMLMYAHENRAYFPVAQLVAGAPGYNLEGRVWNASVDGVGVYWPTFIQKYVTKTKQGVAATNNQDAAAARNTILWGCPAWEGYRTGAIGEYNRVQTGFGMSIWPTFTSTYPAPPTNFPPNPERSYISGWPSAQVGNFIKQNRWTKPAQRALVMDSRFWMVESNPAPANGVIPPQPAISNTITYTAGVPGQTMADVYRHGTYPKVNASPANTFSQTGGKVAFNILYCDGHVSTANEQREAYVSIRQRFPN